MNEHSSTAADDSQLTTALADPAASHDHSGLSRRHFLATSGLAVMAIQARGLGAASAATALSVRNAMQSDRVVNSWGMNTHLNWQNSVWGDEVAATDLLVELGVRYIRGMVAPRQKAQRYAFNRLRDNGCQVEAMLAERVDGNTLAGAQSMVNFKLDEIVNYYGGKAGGVFSALEGCNEPNNDGVSEATWVSQARTVQQAVWEESRKRPQTRNIPVVGPGLARQIGDFAPTVENDFSVVGNLSGWADYVNIHVYPKGNAPSDQIDRFVAASRQAYPGGEPIITTEGGYFNAMSYTATNSPPTTEHVAAVYAPRHLLEHVSRGNFRFFSYELLDDVNPGNDDREANFGYVATPSMDSSTWRKKPVFYAMKAMLALYADPGPTFTPTGLSMAITGAGTDFRSHLVQKRSGKYYLAMWRDIDIYKWDRFTVTGAMLPIQAGPVTVELGLRAPVNLYRPSSSPDGAPESLGATNAFTVPMDGEVVIAEIG